MPRITMLFVLAGSLTVPGIAHAASGPAPLRLYVACSGQDDWSGRLAAPNRQRTDGPFATLERARDEVRRLKERGPRAGGVSVEVRGGIYELPRTLELGAADSGTPEAPVVYRAYGKERVRLAGGREVKGFRPVTDAAALARLDPGARGSVVQADLRAQGIADLEVIRGRGPALELFFRDRPMILARWPNEGFVRVAGVPDGPRGDRIAYDGDRPSRWANEKDGWLHGYWFHDWSDSRQQIVGIDAGQRIISLGLPHHTYGYKKGQRYYALNLLSELDRPGEWYVDREAGTLYFWPPSGERGRVGERRSEGTGAQRSGGMGERAAREAARRRPLSHSPTPPLSGAVVSILPTLVALKDASFVTLRGLTFEATRGTAVTIAGGTGCRVVGCVIRNTGSGGVSVGGRSNGVVGCDIHDTGETGIALDGGDRRTLTPAGNFAENNHIFDYARLERTYRPGVGVNGVGQRVAHNLIHDGPHNGILLGGNDHVIEYNELHSVCYETGDVGAFYSGRRWDWQGTVIRYNHFHDIFGPGNIGAMGVYLDDALSGFTVTGNLFRNVTRAMAICGGRNITVDNNVFIDCKPALHVDARGLNWMKSHIEDYMPKMLKEMPYQSPPWSTRYPHLVNILEDEPGVPKYNLIERNIRFGGTWEAIEAIARPHLTFRDNWTEGDPGFVNPERGDYRLRKHAPALKLGIQPIPIAKMGLYPANARASWPVRHPVRPASAPVEPVAVRTGPPPVYSVLRAAAEPNIDGRLDPAEWGGLDPAQAMVVEQGMDGGKTTPRSLAWILQAPAGLLVAVDNGVRPASPLKLGRQWGGSDAMEIAIDVATPRGGTKRAGKARPAILLLRGFASGHFESSSESGAPAPAVKRAAEGVEYQVQVVDPGRWTAEWRIPFASLGIDPAKQRRLPFNLSLLKTADSLWQMWCGTGGNTWWVDKAGFIELAQ